MAAKMCPNCKGINESYAETCFRCGEIFLCEPDPEENTADAALIKCPGCEAVNVGYAKTCFRCGAMITDGPSPEENTTVDAVIQYKKCVKCKAILDMEPSICPYCNGKLRTFTHTNATPNKQSPQDAKEAFRWLFGVILGIIGVVLWIMGMIYKWKIIRSTMG